MKHHQIKYNETSHSCLVITLPCARRDMKYYYIHHSAVKFNIVRFNTIGYY